ncbi:hypothetical protein B0H17DRAFT_1136415 [Mycena rosella]|uniref:Uncharacterized protein n=1 Tax=Mycena rosella TaxID=1033263 RepID=A0AAD7DBA4_MYCRO|nr:hypothetical protein B0H17DRAFT_1136415 [Mycena rosella]
MSIQALGYEVSPDLLLSLFTPETGALGHMRYGKDFFGPVKPCKGHNDFTTIYDVMRADIFCAPEQVVVPFTTILFGEIKYGLSPNWSDRSWNTDALSVDFDGQLDVLGLVMGKYAALDRVASPIVQPWTDEDTIVVRIVDSTKYATMDYDHVMGEMPLRIGDTVVLQCTPHTSSEGHGKRAVRMSLHIFLRRPPLTVPHQDSLIQARNVQLVVCVGNESRVAYPKALQRPEPSRTMKTPDSVTALDELSDTQELSPSACRPDLSDIVPVSMTVAADTSDRSVNAGTSITGVQRPLLFDHCAHSSQSQAIQLLAACGVEPGTLVGILLSNLLCILSISFAHILRAS